MRQKSGCRLESCLFSLSMEISINAKCVSRNRKLDCVVVATFPNFVYGFVRVRTSETCTFSDKIFFEEVCHRRKYIIFTTSAAEQGLSDIYLKLKESLNIENHKRIHVQTIPLDAQPIARDIH